MKIKGWLFYSFWSITSIAFLKLGFNALDRTGLSKSVYPSIMFLFKHVFAISVIHSSDYRFVNCRLVKLKDDRYHKVVGFCLLLPLMVKLMGFPNSLIIPFFVAHGFIIFRELGEPFFVASSEDWICLGVDFLVKQTLLAYGDSWKFIPVLVLLISCHTSDIWASVSIENERYNTLPVSENRNPDPTFKTGTENGKLVEIGTRIVCSFMFQGENPSIWRRIFRERRKLVEFAIGMVGTILFQYFFPLKSFDHVLAFLYLAVAWLGNIALFGSSSDFGVFNFLLGNVIVGCTVSQFGLRGTTWIAYGVSVFLYGLRVKFESQSLVEDVYYEKRFIVW